MFISRISPYFLLQYYYTTFFIPRHIKTWKKLSHRLNLWKLTERCALNTAVQFQKVESPKWCSNITFNVLF